MAYWDIAQCRWIGAGEPRSNVVPKVSDRGDRDLPVAVPPQRPEPDAGPTLSPGIPVPPEIDAALT